MNRIIANRMYAGFKDKLEGFELPVINNLDEVNFKTLPRDFICAFRPYNSFYFQHNQEIKCIYALTGPFTCPDHERSSAWPSVIIRKFTAEELEQRRVNGDTTEVYPKMEVPQRPLDGRHSKKPLDPEKYYANASADFDKIRAEVPIVNQTSEEREKYNKRKRDGNRSMGVTTLRLSPNSSMQAVKTPKELYDNFNAYFHFDHDPCPIHSDTDAFKTPWGKRNYVNPPFKHAGAFAMRAVQVYKETGGCTVILCPARTSSLWFEWVFNCGYLSAVVFLRSGIKFDGFTNAIPHPMILLCIGTKDGGALGRPPYMLFWDALNTKRKLESTYQTFVTHFDKIGWPTDA